MAGPFDDLIPSAPRQQPTQSGGRYIAPIEGPPSQKTTLQNTKTQIDIQDAPLNRAKTQAELQTSTFKANTQAEDRRFDMAKQLRADFEKLPEVDAYRNSIPMYGLALATDATPEGDLALTTSYAKLTDPSTGVREGEAAAVGASSPYYERTVQNLKNQMDRSGLFTPEKRQALRKELATLMANRNKAYLAVRVNYKKMADRYGVNPLDVVGEHAGIMFQGAESKFLGRPVQQLDYYGRPIPKPNDGPNPQQPNPNDPNGAFPEGIQFNIDKPEEILGYRMAPAKEAAYKAFVAAQNGNPNFTLEQANAFLQSLGEQPLQGNEKDQKWVDAVRKGQAGTSQLDYSQNDAQARARAEAEAKMLQQDSGQAGLQELGTSGALMGSYDEASGIGKALGGLLTGDPNVVQNYQTGRDGMRVRLDQARANTGWAGTGVEFGSGLLTGGVGAVANPIRAATAGGAIAGFNTGEGVRGSATNALLGGTLGFGVAKAAPVAANAMINSKRGQAFMGWLDQRAADKATARMNALDPNAADVVAAGQAEGVRVVDPMINPASRNKALSLRSRPGSANTMERTLSEVQGGIENRVGQLSNGNAMERQAAGESLQNAGVRAIKDTGQRAKRMYDAAEAMAGNAKVAPNESLAEVGAIIKQLSETPGTNEAEIAYLKKLQNDLSENLSVGALRRIRTTLRKKVSSGDLTFGEDEARVLGIMDKASQDITNGLNAVNPNAAKAFQQADNFYRERMTYINDVLKPILGNRNNPLSGEKALTRLELLASPRGGDAKKLAALYRSVEPDEAADIAATFASQIGRRSPDEPFSPDLFVSQARKLSKEARAVIFGPEGAKSVENLITLSNALKSVPRNTSGTAVATNYFDFLTSALGLGGGSLGFLASGNVGTAAAGAVAGAAVGGARTGLNKMSASLMMNRDVTQWIKTAPRSVSPAAIDAHFQRLTQIATRNPAIAEGVKELQSFLMQAANSIPGKLAARENEKNSGPTPPKK